MSSTATIAEDFPFARWIARLLLPRCLYGRMTRSRFGRLPGNARLSACILALSAGLCADGGRAQDYATGRVGSIIEQPEKVSGIWETENGTGVIGIDIELMTTVKGAPATLKGVPQFFRYAQIAVFERRGAAWAFGDANWFTTDAGGARWSENHLEMHGMTNPPKGAPEIVVDLRFDPRTKSWSGRFHRGQVDRVVTLLRPHRRRVQAQSPFVGTWKRGDVMNNCVHVAQEADGQLVAWSDDLIAPGAMRYANGLKPPAETLEEYGSVVQVSAEDGDRIRMELKVLSAMCCSIHTGGILSSDHKYIRSADDRADREWRRVEGDSCRPQ